MNDVVDENFLHIRNLAKDIEEMLANASMSERSLSNELAGMFAVTISATYEGIVKESLISYAGNFHRRYKEHIEQDFSRMNARITIGDLKGYSRQFGLEKWSGRGAKKNATVFDRILNEKRQVVERRFRTDLITNYENIFNWRNSYAHERITSATFGDVYKAHRVAQYVVRSFVKAFEVN